MVGLSVIFETRKLAASDSASHITQKSTLVMNTTTNTNINNHHRRRCSSSGSNFQFPATPRYLHRCYLCRQTLLPGKDIFMYEGDKGFCSEECRCRQIFMDEEQGMPDAGNCSFAAVFNQQTTVSPPSPSPPPSRGHSKTTRNQARGFVY